MTSQIQPVGHISISWLIIVSASLPHVVATLPSKQQHKTEWRHCSNKGSGLMHRMAYAVLRSIFWVNRDHFRVGSGNLSRAISGSWQTAYAIMSSISWLREGQNASPIAHLSHYSPRQQLNALRDQSPISLTRLGHPKLCSKMDLIHWCYRADFSVYSISN